uniref:Uncharacterized protein n=1 Tax=Arundo donax TaxID=35708 RepID=A0A0A9AXE1_ARUDO
MMHNAIAIRFNTLYYTVTLCREFRYGVTTDPVLYRVHRLTGKQHRHHKFSSTNAVTNL